MTDNEKREILNEHEMSPEEMKTISGGGVKIDWPAACKSTVENGSDCWGTDACYVFNEAYLRDRNKFGCSATVGGSGGGGILSWCSSNDYCELNEIRYAFCDSNWRKESSNGGHT